MIRFYIFVLLINTFFCSSSKGQAESNSIHSGEVEVIPEVLGRSHPDYIVNQLKQLASLEASLHQLPQTPSDLLAYKQFLTSEIIKSTGALFHHDLPLNMKETGSRHRKGFTVKNIVFQTRPGIYATANLYVPDGKGKFPGVLVMMGHSPNGRFYQSYQDVGLSLVLHGYVSLCIDPWGAGERGTTHGVFEDHGDENNLGSCLMDVGETLMGLQITDNSRAVDLLCSLPFVDSENIGATGASGGGNQTLWITAMDERIKASVPVVSSGTFEAYMLGSPCICEVLPGGLRFTEEAGILAIIAPRAIKMISHSLDDILAFRPKEMMRSYTIVQPVFKIFEAEDKLAYKVFDLPHGYFPEDRAVMLGWFDLFLKNTGAGDPVKHSLPDTIPYEQLMVFPPGKRDPSVVSTEEFCRQRGSELRSGFLSQHAFDPDIKRSELRRMVGADEKLSLIMAHTYSKRNGWNRLALQTSDGKVLPVLLHPPLIDSGEYVIVCNSDGMRKTPSSIIEEYMKSGAAVVLMDLSGTGENKSLQSNLHDRNGNLLTLTRSEYWLGQTLIGEWLKELEVLTGYLKSHRKAGRIAIDGTKDAGMAALLMAALNGNVSSLILRNMPLSYLYDKRQNIDYFSMAMHIPGILKWGDVSLISALTGSNITFIDPLTISGTVLTEKELKDFQAEFEKLRENCSERGSVSFVQPGLQN